MADQYDYDLFTIGAGSGGVRASRVAASHGARVAVAEEHRVGGTTHPAFFPSFNPGTPMGKTFKALADHLTRALEVVMVLCLVVMLVMVFVRVLRLSCRSGPVVMLMG